MRWDENEGGKNGVRSFGYYGSQLSVIAENMVIGKVDGDLGGEGGLAEIGGERMALRLVRLA